MGRAFEFRKARKMKRWSAMSKAFTRIGKDIVMAVKEGGADPDSNSRLRAVIQNGKAVNMPKDNIERAIKRASDKSQGDYKEVLFEGYAHHGIAILVETATDNNTRTVANVRSYFNKCNGSLGTSGSVVFMFDHTCNFRINSEGLDVEEIELEFIDFGAEEVFTDDDYNTFTTRLKEWQTQQRELEQKAIEIQEVKTDAKENIEHYKNLFEYQRKQIDRILEMHERLIVTIGEQTQSSIQRNHIEAKDKKYL